MRITRDDKIAEMKTSLPFYAVFDSIGNGGGCLMVTTNEEEAISCLREETLRYATSDFKRTFFAIPTTDLDCDCDEYEQDDDHVCDCAPLDPYEVDYYCNLKGNWERVWAEDVPADSNVLLIAERHNGRYSILGEGTVEECRAELSSIGSDMDGSPAMIPFLKVRDIEDNVSVVDEIIKSWNI